MTDKKTSVVRGVRIRTETLEALEVIRQKKYEGLVKLNGIIVRAIVEYIKREQDVTGQNGE